MKYLSRLSIKSRLLLMLLGVSLTSILIIGILSVRTAQDALQQSIENQLTSIRALKAEQLTTYYNGFLGVAHSLAESNSVVTAMENFIIGYRDASEQMLTSEQQQELTAFYEDQFLPQLAETTDETPLLALYRPQRQTTSYFQYHYVVNNPFTPERRDELFVAEDDTTTYGRIHAAYHPGFYKLREELGYQDLLLIDIRTGNIVYSTGKAVDFGTSLYDGPYRSTGLGMLVAQIRDNPQRDVVQGMDYQPYPPYLNTPVGYYGVPVYKRSEAIGILVLQLPGEAINEVMTDGGDWSNVGLGETGESYLVGDDGLMRSVSRFYIEDKDAYLAMMRDAGLPESTIEAMERTSTVLLQPVDTEAARRALDGETGTMFDTDYRGVKVLTSYEPFNLSGGDTWAVISQIDVAEAAMPIYSLQRTILIWTVGLTLAVAFLAILLAQIFVRPIDKLATGAQLISAGRDDVYVDVRTNDELGDLARSFNSMVESIRRQKTAIAEKNAENQRLLLNILPASIAARLKTGERIADQLQQVSIIFIRMIGFTALSENWTAQESAALLEQLIDMLDDATERHDLERVKVISQTYIAACGLTTARLDHASRTVDFALEVIQIVRRLDQEYQQELAVQIGINSGPVVSGVVGSNRFNFELWGETVELARHLHTQAEPNQILISESVYQRIDKKSKFQLHSLMETTGGDISVYQLGDEKDIDIPESTAVAEGESS